MCKKNEIIPFNILLLGDKKVGKKTFLETYIGSSVLPQKFNKEKTYFSVEINGLNFKVKYEYNNEASRIDYQLQSVNLVLLCFDMNNTDNFPNIKNSWFDSFKKSSCEKLVLLLGNNFGSDNTVIEDMQIDNLNKTSSSYVNFTFEKLNFTDSVQVKEILEKYIELVYKEDLGSKSTPNASESCIVF